MKTVSDLKVGDTAWWVDVNGRGVIYDDTVTKIGTKLIDVGRRSFRKDSLRTNDQFGHQTLIPDLEHYKEQQEILRIKDRIRSGLTYRIVDVSLEDVKKAAELLRIDIEDAK